MVPDASPATQGTPDGDGHLHRRTGTAGRRRSGWLSRHLGPQDLFDALRDVRLPAAADTPSHEAPSTPRVVVEVRFDRLTSELGDRLSLSVSLVSELGIQIIGKLHG